MKKSFMWSRMRLLALLLAPLSIAMSLVAMGTAQAATITATIGCNSSAQVVYTANGTGLPKSVTLDIYVDRWATGVPGTRSHRTQNTNSAGSISLPTFSGPTMAVSDFDDEYVRFTFQRNTTLLGSASASAPTCGDTGGGGWSYPLRSVAVPAVV